MINLSILRTGVLPSFPDGRNGTECLGSKRWLLFFSLSFCSLTSHQTTVPNASPSPSSHKDLEQRICFNFYSLPTDSPDHYPNSLSYGDNKNNSQPKFPPGTWLFLGFSPGSLSEALSMVSYSPRHKSVLFSSMTQQGYSFWALTPTHPKFRVTVEKASASLPRAWDMVGWVQYSSPGNPISKVWF